MIYSVYIHKFPNNKVYVGITQQAVKDRWKCPYNRYFENAVRKYGWDNIEHCVVAEVDTREEACELEKELIAKYKSFDRQYGYNLTTGGDGGYALSVEAKRLIGENSKKCMTGRKMSESTKRKIRVAMTGRKFSPESIKKMCLAQKGRVSPNKGKPMSEEQKHKISVARKGYKMSDEQKEKLRLANIGKKHTDISKQKRSDKMKELRYVNNGKENYRVKVSEVQHYLDNGYSLGIVHTIKYKTKKKYRI